RSRRKRKSARIETRIALMRLNMASSVPGKALESRVAGGRVFGRDTSSLRARRPPSERNSATRELARGEDRGEPRFNDRGLLLVQRSDGALADQESLGESTHDQPIESVGELGVLSLPGVESFSRDLEHGGRYLGDDAGGARRAIEEAHLAEGGEGGDAAQG